MNISCRTCIHSEMIDDHGYKVFMCIHNYGISCIDREYQYYEGKEFIKKKEFQI